MPDQTLSPTADGLYQEIPYPARPHYNTFCESDADIWKVDTYVMGNPTRIGVITNVRVLFSGQSRPTPGGVQFGRTALYKSGSSIRYGSQESLDSSDLVQYYTDYALNPWTGVAWTWGDVDALEAGFALKGHSYASYAHGSDAYLVVSSVPLSNGGAQIIGLELL